MLELCGSVPDIPVPTRRVPLDEQIATLAAAQHGVVARRQLIALGATRSMIETRIARGLLLPLHRGVYAVGHRRLRRKDFGLRRCWRWGPTRC
jgi:hypothetical protein